MGADRHTASSQKSTTPAKQERTVDRISLKMKPFSKDLRPMAPIALNIDNAVPHNSDARFRSHSLRHLHQLIGRPPIIAVQERNNFPIAFRDALIERRCLPAIFLAQQPHAGLEFLHDFRRAIRRAVIDDNNLTLRRRKILLQDAHDRLFDEALVVVGVNQYADKTSRQLQLSKILQSRFCAKQYKYVPLKPRIRTYGYAANARGKQAAYLIRLITPIARCRKVGFARKTASA